MKRKIIRLVSAAVLAGTLLAGCAGTDNDGQAEKETLEAQESPQGEAAPENETEPEGGASAKGQALQLEDGVYTVDFDSDSSMFHVSEACEGKGTLTVENGEMTLHVSLASKNIVNLFPGLAEDAKKDGARLLEPTTDSVTYSDGITEEVYGFDIPVPVLEEEFDLALIGTKGTWYDHKVSVSNPEKAE